MHIVTFLAGISFATVLVVLGPELAVRVLVVVIVIAVVIVAKRSK